MATLKIKMLPRSILKGKVGIKFPASLTGEGGIVVTTVGRDVTIGFNQNILNSIFEPKDNTLTALAALTTTPGLLAQTATDTFTKRSLVAPAAGLTIANPAGTADNPTFALANDLSAVEGLTGTGIARRTGLDAWSVGTTVSPEEGGTGQISYTTGDILYASGAAALSKLAASTSGYALLANGAGVAPSYQGFTQSGTGAVARTWQTKLRDIVSVKDFGAIGDGVADDTGKIQAALDAVSAAGGGTVYLPSGTYLIAATLTLPGSVILQGAGSSQTKITTASATLTYVSVNSGFYSQIRGIQFTTSATPTSGTTISIGVNAFSFSLDDVFILNCWNGINCIGTNNSTRLSIGFVTNLKIYNFRNIALNFQYCNDIFVSNFLIYQKDIANTFGQYGIALSDNCEAIILTNGDVVGGQYSLNMTSAAATTAGARPAYNSFVSVYFDSAINGSVINACAETTFTNCWWSGGRVAPAPGLTINEGDTNHFIGCKWFNCGTHGCVVSSGAERTHFTNCSFSDNNTGAASGTNHGLAIANSASGVQVIGGAAKNGNLSGTQGYGINVGTGVINLMIEGVDVRGNVTGGISAGTALSTTVIIKNCIGFVSEARGVATVPNAAAGVAVAHGLSGTPTTVVCTLKDTGGGAQAGGTNIPRVHTIGATSFVFDIGVVASADRPFSWEAKL